MTDNIRFNPEAPIWRVPALFAQSLAVLLFGLVFPRDTEARPVDEDVLERLQQERDLLKSLVRRYEFNDEEIPSWLQEALALIAFHLERLKASLVPSVPTQDNGARLAIVNNAEGSGLSAPADPPSSGPPASPLMTSADEDGEIMRLTRISLDLERINGDMALAVARHDVCVDDSKRAEFKQIIERLRQERKALEQERALILVGVSVTNAPGEIGSQALMTREEREADALARRQATWRGRMGLAAREMVKDLTTDPFFSVFKPVLGAALLFDLQRIFEMLHVWEPAIPQLPLSPFFAAVSGVATMLGLDFMTNWAGKRLIPVFRGADRITMTATEFSVKMCAVTGVMLLTPFWAAQSLGISGWHMVAVGSALLVSGALFSFKALQERMKREMAKKPKALPKSVITQPRSETLTDLELVATIAQHKLLFIRPVSEDSILGCIEALRQNANAQEFIRRGPAMVSPVFEWLYGETVTESRLRIMLYLLGLLGYQAESAVPELGRIAENKLHERMYQAIVSELGCLVTYIVTDKKREANRRRFAPPRPLEPGYIPPDKGGF